MNSDNCLSQIPQSSSKIFYDNDNCMTNTPQSPQSSNKKTSKVDILLIMIALSGEYPYNGFHRLAIGTSYARQLRHRLYQQDMIKLIKQDGLKGLVLTYNGIEVMKKSNPDRFRYMSDKPRTELTRRYRKQMFARTYCSLLNADVEFLPDRTPFLYTHQRHQPYTSAYPLLQTDMLTEDKPCFYSSVEIKYELEDYVQQIRNSAMMGMVLTRKEVFGLYHVGENRYPLSYATELTAALMIRNGTIIDMEQDTKAIVLVSDFEIASELIYGNKEKRMTSSRFILNEAYQHIYLVPETSEGDTQLEVITHKEYRNMIEDTLTGAYGEPKSNYKTINDGFDKTGNPVLNGCLLDIIRLMKFKRGLLANDISGKILCFDFQMDFISMLMRPAKVTISNIKIQDVREWINAEKDHKIDF